jgi:toxin-antitoxin system PIN domain toxin
MIIPDLNLLVYAYNRSAPEHENAKGWWERLLSGNDAVSVPWAVSLGFLRLMTNRLVLRDPMPVAEAVARVQEWFEADNVNTLNPGSRHWTILSTLLTKLGTAGNLVTDAHLAALAIEHNAELHSNDADFSRIPGPRVVNPLLE